MTNKSILNSSSFLLSDVEDWCSPSRVSAFCEFVRPLQSIMLWSNNYQSLAKSWILREMVIDALNYKNLDKPLDYENLYSSKELSWKKNDTIYQSFDSIILENELEPFLMQKIILDLWAQKEWGHRLEAMYLEKKNKLDRVTCSLLRVTDQYLAVELYYRLKSNENSFDELSWKFAQGKEKKFGGKFINQRIQDLPDGFSQFIQKVKPGEVLKPHSIGKYYVIIQLDDFSPAQFDEETKRYLLSSELDGWLQALMDLLSSKI